ncbi:glycosyltransferase [Nocardioides iriomotensis]|uniref:glycosyltransferase n=1 Tax=Nocardioides iriomotensis TaxID=715784 RepID=UPI0023EA4E17|nr:glycosyltransferase [Nocardioides iriomotensis]
MRVHVLVFDAFGGGGVARTVVNLANHLAAAHDVTLLSLFRSRRVPRFAHDPRLAVRVLHPTPRRRSALRAELEARPSRLRPAPAEARMNHLTDLVLRRGLAGVTEGVLLSTRPSLHLAALQLRPTTAVPVVGQDHGHFENRFAPDRSTAVLDAAVPGLDGFAVLTAADAADYRARYPDAAARIHHLPNALPWPVAEAPAPLDAPVIVTAGRLDAAKGHARMIRAFAPVAAAHPDWQLHVYGAGPEDRALEAQVEQLGLAGRVRLRGYSLDLRSVLASASVYALASHTESFSMSLIEAMSVGLPTVAMDCPRGPREIVRDGETGFLVPDGDEAGFTAALLRLVEDADLRRRMGAAGLARSHEWSMETVGHRWETLLESLAAGSPPRTIP